jgi:hypothetical protein
MTTFRLAPILALTAGLLCACDPPINTLVAPEAGAASVIDAGVEGGFRLAACKECIEPPDTGPGCRTEYAACSANAECTAMIACTFTAGCYGGPSSLYINCALPCAMEAGAFAANDPVLALASPLFNCIVGGACTPTCFAKK